MPKDRALRIEIIQLYYNILVVGYREKWKIIELVTRNSQQLGIMRDKKIYREI